MKRVFIIGLMLCTLCCMADERKGLITDSLTRSVVHQDSAITRLLDRKVNGTGTMVVQQGYRVQVYSSNNGQTSKTEAAQLEQMLRQKVSVGVYMQYVPPFWKVRLGDFKTQEEALAYKQEFVQSHPQLQGDTYIVRDQINVLQ